ncbi:hypothetical protein SAMN04487917_11317 [Arthrobacter sp. yr096]|uniref:hypothetical protein n=1 Tax=Arthrobacter sp. yr096 TaxID=1761750 RepID=UPI0008BA6FE6|nr:hypothetical protein [Arthrobacter sp. yr096]SEJ77197.1 hypothetical protein SAMN04487917_11317 [Arthrobacter sp. yr096]
MDQIYVLDSSALQTLNELATDDDTLTERLTELRDNSQVIYCEAAKNERQRFAKGDPVTIWAASGWRSLKDAAEVRWPAVSAVCVEFGIPTPPDLHILDPDNEETDQQQAIVTIALARKMTSSYNVIVVSDEDFTLENRCTVPEACTVLGMEHCTVKDFLESVDITVVTKAP